MIHGHNWGFNITFSCDFLDDCGFVVDVGGLKCVKEFLEECFDHTLLLNEDDRSLLWFQETLDNDGKAKIIIVPNCGMEGLAQFVHEKVGAMIGDDAGKLYNRLQKTGQARGLRVTQVICYEDSKNYATYTV